MIRDGGMKEELNVATSAMAWTCLGNNWVNTGPKTLNPKLFKPKSETRNLTNPHPQNAAQAADALQVVPLYPVEQSSLGLGLIGSLGSMELFTMYNIQLFRIAKDDDILDMR